MDKKTKVRKFILLTHKEFYFDLIWQFI